MGHPRWLVKRLAFKRELMKSNPKLLTPTVLVIHRDGGSSQVGRVLTRPKFGPTSPLTMQDSLSWTDFLAHVYWKVTCRGRLGKWNKTISIMMRIVVRNFKVSLRFLDGVTVVLNSRKYISCSSNVHVATCVNGTHRAPHKCIHYLVWVEHIY